MLVTLCEMLDRVSLTTLTCRERIPGYIFMLPCDRTAMGFGPEEANNKCSIQMQALSYEYTAIVTEGVK